MLLWFMMIYVTEELECEVKDGDVEVFYALLVMKDKVIFLKKMMIKYGD